MNNFKITLNSKEINSNDIFPYVKNGNLRDAIIFMKNKTGCSKDEAYEVYKELKQMLNPNPLTKLEVDSYKKQHSPTKQSNHPKCPTCGSTNVKKISVTSKAVGAGLFGLFSKTAKSQFECENCGYKW